ncbi:hypothetical protein HO173_002931 [Letharia columbiana]|uniref:Uncharacterized protein n=1 Tax=Letharia columbiana TaxID=112416 RepID=A0A8H6G290_9LECA|nr:uncharacterized protein HO173_002931 [Letharia columbiana]KAF6239059.1 hypothetical protein HO173_002931 [Letharia columbiana]
MGKFNCSGILTGSTSRASTVQANVLDEPPVQFYAAQPLFFWPRAFQTERLDAPKPPFPGSASGSIPCTSRPLATTPSPAVGTAAGLRNPPQVGELALSTFGGPEQTIVPGVPDTTCVLVSIPGFCNRAEQSFEEARLRRYEFYHGESEPLVTPKWPETTFGHSKAPAPYTVVRSLFIASRSGLLSAEQRAEYWGGERRLGGANPAQYGYCRCQQ